MTSSVLHVRNPADPIQVSRGLVRLHTAAEAALRTELRRRGARPTCRPGCSACCRRLALIGYAEATAISVALLKGGLTEETVEQLAAAARAAGDGDFTDAEYFARGIRCAFLSPEGMCRIYDDRPLCCRTHVSLSPPDRCMAPYDSETPPEILDTQPLSLAAAAFSEALRVAVGEVVVKVGPLALMVLFRLRQLVPDRRDVAAAVDQLPAPHRWIRRYEAARVHRPL